MSNVTVTRVEVSPDGQQARIYVSILGDEKEQQLCLHGLRSARGFLQSKVAARTQARYTPILEFVNDPGVKKSIEISRIIRESLPDPEQSRSDDDDLSESHVDEGESASSL